MKIVRTAALLLAGISGAAFAGPDRTQEIDYFTRNIAELESVLADCKARPELRENALKMGKALVGIQREYLEQLKRGIKTDEMVAAVSKTIDGQAVTEMVCAGMWNNAQAR